MTSLKNLTIGLIWLVTGGEAWGGLGQGGGQGRQKAVWEQQTGDEGGRRGGGGQGGGQGGADGGGHQRAVWEHWFHLFKNLTIGLIWLVTRGQGVGRGGPGRRARGGRWGGAPESSVGATRRSLVPPFALP